MHAKPTTVSYTEFKYCSVALWFKWCFQNSNLYFKINSSLTDPAFSKMWGSNLCHLLCVLWHWLRHLVAMWICVTIFLCSVFVYKIKNIIVPSYYFKIKWYIICKMLSVWNIEFSFFKKDFISFFKFPLLILQMYPSFLLQCLIWY